MFEKVTRYKAKLRIALTGVSGAGKTLGALYIAYGITGNWGKIALIDTEHERARFYANRSDLGTGEFLYAVLKPPYSPQKYKKMVQEGAQAVGSDGVVIVDSFSHAWNNEGGVLDIKDQISKRQGQTSYTAWNEAGREQNSLVNTILSAECHVIVTMRSKMDYALVENDRGKMVPQKLGLAPVQREDTEYEFDVVLDIGRNHIATASKDTTFLDKFGEVITPQLGQQLSEWINSGVEPPKPPVEPPKPPVEPLKPPVEPPKPPVEPMKLSVEPPKPPVEPPKPSVCAECGRVIKDRHRIGGGIVTADEIKERAIKTYGVELCLDCAMRRKKDVESSSTDGQTYR